MHIKKYVPGIFFTLLLAYISMFFSGLIPYNLIGAGVFALLIGMLLNPVISKYTFFDAGLGFTSKKILRLAIVLMGLGLSFKQVMEVGKFSLFVMIFTLATAFGGGYLLGKLFHMNWKLSSLISAGTGICGGSAIAAIAPVIEAEESDIAYGISATFIFDVLMVILFPIAGRYFHMSDLGYGLWTGTAVNDTSSVVAAGYAFSDMAGKLSVIVKLTRTLSIIPIVLIFSYINERLLRKEARLAMGNEEVASTRANEGVNIRKIFPWFILMFLGMVIIKSLGFVPESVSHSLSNMSKLFMVMSLGAIGLRTNFKKLAKSGFTPMIHGFIISALVVVVSFLVQMMFGQI
ncbi:YeiH family protein [Irregularibacter muris]|uniref:YeiH family protein n=1 Tax=Irregularibacter muris TaxID=1796619 RepID=A0AAE3KYL7_9FIRM|nr:YeiH family protein [Irregularibacter muris]MCR1897690.1 YeiH family protein [Irregularibacter muris]